MGQDKGLVFSHSERTKLKKEQDSAARKGDRELPRIEWRENSMWEPNSQQEQLESALA